MKAEKSAYVYYDLKDEDISFEFRLLLVETMKNTCIEKLIICNTLDEINKQIELEIKKNSTYLN